MMRFIEHHGGSQGDLIQHFLSPFGLAEYLYLDLRRFYVPVTFENIHAERQMSYNRIPKGWEELWLVSIDGYGVCGWVDSWFEEKV